MAEERRAGATRFVPPIARRNRDEDKEPRQEAVAVIRSASINNDGQATLVLDDGSVWKQFGERSLRKAPTPGAEATFRKAMFGSYFVKLEGEPAIRVSRIR